MLTPSSQITDVYTFRRGAIKGLCRVLSLERNPFLDDFMKTSSSTSLIASSSKLSTDGSFILPFGSSSGTGSERRIKFNKHWISQQNSLFKTIEIRFKLNTFQGSHGYHLSRVCYHHLIHTFLARMLQTIRSRRTATLLPQLVPQRRTAQTRESSEYVPVEDEWNH